MTMGCLGLLRSNFIALLYHRVAPLHREVCGASDTVWHVQSKLWFQECVISLQTVYYALCCMFYKWIVYK
jgi:hypothetical protein